IRDRTVTGVQTCALPISCGYGRPSLMSCAMRRYFACICVFLIGTGPIEAGLRCVPPSVDLGEIRGGPPRQHRFELVNDGQQTIRSEERRVGKEWRSLWTA